MGIGFAVTSLSRGYTQHRRAAGPLLLCVAVLGLGVGIAQGQWLEKVIYLPDSLSGVLWPSCIAGNPEFHKVYVSGTYDENYRGDLDVYVIVIDSRTGEKRARIPVQSKVSVLAYNHLTNKLYAAYNRNTTVIDGQTDAVVHTFQGAPYVYGLCCNTVNGRVYRSSVASESLYVIDGSGDSVVAKINVPGGQSSLTFDSVGNKLYCGYDDGYDRQGLLVIDGDADTILTDIPTPFAVSNAAVCRRHPRLYSIGAVDGSSILLIVDTGGDTIVGTIPTGGAGRALGINELRDELYFGASGDTIVALDCSGDTVSRRLAAFPGWYIRALLCLPQRDRLICLVNSTIYLLDLATGDIVPGSHPGSAGAPRLLDETEARLYLVGTGDDVVTILDVSTDSIVESDVLVGSRPATLCVATRANKVYAGDATRGSVYSLDCASGVVKVIRLPGANVRALCYDSLDNKVYCASMAAHVHVIDCTTDSVIAAVATGTRPMQMAYVLRHNRIYVANEDGSSLTVIDCRNDSRVCTVPLYGTSRNPLYNPERDEVLIACPGYFVAVVDCSTNTWVDTLAYTPVYPIYCQAVKKIYLAGVGTYDLVVLDAASDSLVATIPGVIGIGGGVNETDCKVYTLSYLLERFVGIVDARVDTAASVITSIPVPTSVTHDVLNDKVYITSAVSPGQVFVLDGRTDSILDSIPVLGHVPSQAVWNSLDGRTYVGNSYSGSISVIRDSLVPGVQEAASVPRTRGTATVLRQLSLPAGVRVADVYDISGRRVLRLRLDSDYASRLGVGVYFVREGQSCAQAQAVRKVVVVR